MAGKSAVKSSEKSDPKSSIVIKGYLLTYNVVQFFGWSHILYLTVNHYLSGGTTKDIWPVVSTPLFYFQNAAIIEVINVLLGYVRSAVLITAIQVASRVVVVSALLGPAPPAQVSIGLPLILAAWSVTEIIRYSFYALNLINAVPYFIVWCRYTFFYALYPIGVTGELTLFYVTQSYAGETKLWTSELPNPLNFTFSYRYILLAIMASYVQFPQMYMHMVNQRKKVIGGATTSAPSTSKKAK